MYSVYHEKAVHGSVHQNKHVILFLKHLAYILSRRRVSRQLCHCTGKPGAGTEGSTVSRPGRGPSEGTGRVSGGQLGKCTVTRGRNMAQEVGSGQGRAAPAEGCQLFVLLGLSSLSAHFSLPFVLDHALESSLGVPGMLRLEVNELILVCVCVQRDSMRKGKWVLLSVGLLSKCPQWLPPGA